MTTQESTTAASATLRTLFRRGDFRHLWLGQVVSAFGDNVTNLTLLILINALTGSTAALATMTILLAIPQVTVGLVAGVFVDRWDRKRVLLASDLIRGLLVLGFIAVGSTERLWLLYLLAFLQACVGTFFNPARSALMPTLVPADELLAANSAMQTGSLVAQVLGAGAAGLVVGAFAVYWPAFALDALTFFVSFALILLVRSAASQPESDAPASVWAIGRQLGVGLGLLVRTRVLLGIVVVTAVMMLGLGTVNVLFVPLLANDLQVPVTWFGAVEFAQVAAMILSGSLVVLLARYSPAALISVASLLLGVAVGLIAVAANVWQVLLILFVVGACITPLQAAIQTIMQTTVPNQLLGRVGSALNTTIMTANLSAMAFAGGLGSAIGIRNVFLFAGGMTILAGLLAMFMLRKTSQEEEIAEGLAT